MSVVIACAAGLMIVVGAYVFFCSGRSLGRLDKYLEESKAWCDSGGKGPLPTIAPDRFGRGGILELLKLHLQLIALRFQLIFLRLRNRYLGFQLRHIRQRVVSLKGHKAQLFLKCRMAALPAAGKDGDGGSGNGGDGASNDSDLGPAGGHSSMVSWPMAASNLEDKGGGR